MSDSPKPKKRTTDIGQQRVGKIYAQAMLDAAGSVREADELLDELGGFVNGVFASAPGLEAMLASPRVSNEEKAALLEKMLDNRGVTGLLKFLKVVCSHGRLECLRSIYAEACSLQNERKGVIEVEMVTAEAPDPQVIRKVKESLAARMGAEIELRTSTDPSLIGGVMVRVGDKVLDASIRQKLHLIREQAVSLASQDMRAHTERFAS